MTLVEFLLEQSPPFCNKKTNAYWLVPLLHWAPLPPKCSVIRYCARTSVELAIKQNKKVNWLICVDQQVSIDKKTFAKPFLFKTAGWFFRGAILCDDEWCVVSQNSCHTKSHQSFQVRVTLSTHVVVVSENICDLWQLLTCNSAIDGNFSFNFLCSCNFWQRWVIEWRRVAFVCFGSCGLKFNRNFVDFMLPVDDQKYITL